MEPKNSNSGSEPCTNPGKMHDRTMDDLISRQAAIAYAISGRVRTLPTSEDGENWIRTEDVRQSLLTMPSEQPEQIVAKQILWMEIKEKPGFKSYTPHCKCSNCGHELILENINYCYVCGARFVGKEI